MVSHLVISLVSLVGINTNNRGYVHLLVSYLLIVLVSYRGTSTRYLSNSREFFLLNHLFWYSVELIVEQHDDGGGEQ